MFIPLIEPYFNGNELKYVTDCIKSRWVSSLGSYVNKFEKEFSDYCGCKHGVAVSNGTAALHLSLVALGIKEGDEVIVPNLTFVATANSVGYTGAKPVFVDVGEDTWNINLEKIEEKITRKTKAIIVVHLYGHPCDMDKILNVAERNNLIVIEDCAQAHGALYKGRKVGSIGKIGCFSFYGNKVITTGEGGMCVTDDKGLAGKIAFLKDQAMKPERKYWHEEIGFDYRMSNMEAALGLAQLEEIDKFINAKRRNAAYYNKLLKETKGINLPVENEYTKSIYWLYSIVLDSEYGISAAELIKKLNGKGIDSRAFFTPMNKLPPYKQEGDFEVSNMLASNGISLPSSVNLKKEQIEYICNVIKNQNI